MTERNPLPTLRLRPFDNIVDMFDHAAGRRPRGVAMICGDDRLTYAEYRRCVAGLAAWLGAHRVGAGDRVAVVNGNGLETSIAAHAVWAAGGQTVLLNPLYTEHELGPLLADAMPTIVLCDDALREMLAPLAAAAGAGSPFGLGAAGLDVGRWRTDAGHGLPAARPGPGDPAALIYTGGTTGLPKAAFHTHASLMAMVYLHDASWHLGAPDNVVLNVAPQSHIWGLGMTLLSPLLGANTIVNMPRYRPDLVVAALARHRVTIFAGGPSTIYHGLMGAPEIRHANLARLRRCFGGGAPFAAETLRAWERLTGVRIYEGYGMSEAAPLTGTPIEGPAKVGSAGPAVPETEVEVVDVATGRRALAAGETGELRFRGPQVVCRYWNRPEETAAAIRDGWIHTGDIGFVDADGWVHIVDRKKDMVIVGGYNVYPREIDEVLFAHPAVREAATVGVPDQHWGEALCAYVVLMPGQDAGVEELRAWCAERLAEFKVPSALRIAAALPKTAARKIDKRALRERAKSDR